MKRTRTWLRRQTSALTMHLAILGSLGVLAATMAKSDMGAGGGAPAAAPPAAPPDTGGSTPPAPAAPPPQQESAPAGNRPLEEWSPQELAAHARKLQEENVKYKDRFRPWEETFGGIRQEDVDDFRGFVGDIMSRDPQRIEKAAAWMRQNLDQLSPAQQAAVQQAADAAAPAGEEFDPYDRASIDKMIEERAAAIVDDRLSAREQQQQAQQQQTQMIADMNEYATKLGKDLGIPDFADPKSLLSKTLYLTAHEDPELQSITDWKERLSAAADKVHMQRAAWAAEYLKSKSEDADTPTTPPAGEAPSGSKPPATFEDARKSALSRLSKSEPGT